MVEARTGLALEKVGRGVRRFNRIVSDPKWGAHYVPFGGDGSPTDHSMVNTLNTKTFHRWGNFQRR